ncbi:MAG: dihydrolipoyl dehydrogenase [Chloroflexales bacterium]|nr:dihydrolipoyl dehydrogenase [Chloroflexales bacterium]
MTAEPRSFDVIIIGGGPGGYVAAMRAGQLGMSVGLVEKEDLGGICLNWGCIPSKTMLKSAEVLTTIANAKEFGVTVGEVTADYPKALKRARDIAERQAKGVAYLMRKYKVEVFRGAGKLSAADRVSVEGPEGGVELKANKGVILATGSRIKSLPTLKLDGKMIFSSKEVWNLEYLPKSILLVGAGPIGCEFATVFSAFGSKVTLLEALPRALPREDPESSAVLSKEFKKRGINIVTGMILASAEVQGDIVRVHLEPTPPNKPVQVNDWDTKPGVEQTPAVPPAAPIDLDVERVMLSAGFAPNSENIGLEALGIEKDQRGYIKVDGHMRTNVAGVYAIGDVTGWLPLAHVAEAMGQVAAETISGQQFMPLDYNAMPRATYSDPQVASLGVTEEEAKQQGIKYRVATSAFMPNGKARAIGDNVGQVKLLVAEPSGEIIGAHMVGPEVTELINMVTLARRLEATPLELGRAVAAHPSLSEVLAEAALEWAGMPIAG